MRLLSCPGPPHRSRIVSAHPERGCGFPPAPSAPKRCAPPRRRGTRSGTAGSEPEIRPECDRPQVNSARQKGHLSPALLTRGRAVVRAQTPGITFCDFSLSPALLSGQVLSLILTPYISLSTISVNPKMPSLSHNPLLSLRIVFFLPKSSLNSSREKINSSKNKTDQVFKAAT